MHRIHNAIGIEILNFVFDANALCLGAEFINPATLFRHFIFQLDKRAVNSALLLPDTAALILFRNAIGNFRGFIFILVQNTDLNEFGVSNFPNIDHFSKPEDRLFLSNNTVEFFPLLLEAEGFDHRVKNFLSLNNLELRCNKSRIKASTASSIIEQLQVSIILINLHRDTGFVLLRKKIGHHTRRYDNKQEYENNKRKPYSNNAPVIEEVKLDFVRVCVVHHSGYQSSMVRWIDQIALLRRNRSDNYTARTGENNGQNQKSMFKPTKATLRW